MTLLKEMLFVLDLAQRAGSPDDMRAADRLQRRCGGCVELGGMSAGYNVSVRRSVPPPLHMCHSHDVRMCSLVLPEGFYMTI